MIYCAKPVKVEARQYDGSYDGNRDIIEWAKGSKTPAFMDTVVRNCSEEHPDGFDYPVLKIGTLEGDHVVSNGDYVIKGLAGEFYPCKPDIFEAKYDLVPPVCAPPVLP